MRHINIIVDKTKYIKSAYPDYYSNSKSEKVTGIMIIVPNLFYKNHVSNLYSFKNSLCLCKIFFQRVG